MMSQNRQAEKDRLTAQNDYTCDVKGEEEIRHIMGHLDHQDTLILQIIKRLEAQHEEMLQHLRELDPEIANRLGTDMKTVSREVLASDNDISGNSYREGGQSLLSLPHFSRPTSLVSERTL